MTDRPKESDWKKFRKLVPEARERYLARRNAELIAILNDESLTPTERFWAASEHTEEIGKILTACLDRHSRSRMLESLFLMFRYSMLTDEDLEDFSDELRARAAHFWDLQ